MYPHLDDLNQVQALHFCQFCHYVIKETTIYIIVSFCFLFVFVGVIITKTIN